ncbi:NAD(P)/FAD-dependent oxidoreductase [Emcibacter sp.]|uniref:NAD(P)/FAD-dependent oxidoreductase n=1 Tax=Emcibacter sp. TaxID=1979954 RepID=UPI002AA761DB|nr:FAD-dependent oxidoreductase [Emcibacter sp.]
MYLTPRMNFPFPPAGGDRQQKIAVVGSGISGLASAWMLSRIHHVSLFEKNDYIGGHSNTIDLELGHMSFPVDTGFIVYNPQNYPNLVALFDILDVPTEPTEMSFSVSLDDGWMEYSGTGLTGLLAQKKNLMRPQFWRMTRDILKFYRHCSDYMKLDDYQQISLGTFLKKENFSDSFINYHLAPMGAAIWSCTSEDILNYPLQAFLSFFQNHGLTQLSNRPEWRTVKGGSREYINRIIKPFSNNLYLNTPVRKIRRLGNKVLVCSDRGDEIFDHVIMAGHADDSLALLQDATPQERDILSAFSYQDNDVWVHSDLSLMPKRQAAWASWNYLGSRANRDGSSLCVTYWMNKLQSLPTDRPVLVTLNPDREIQAGLTHRKISYRHPLFDQRALDNQKRLWSIQGQQNTWFCGAYFGAGFHEDGLQSGLAVAELLSGVPRPWWRPNQNSRIGLAEELTSPDREAVAL